MHKDHVALQINVMSFKSNDTSAELPSGWLLAVDAHTRREFTLPFVRRQQSACIQRTLHWISRRGKLAEIKFALGSRARRVGTLLAARDDKRVIESDPRQRRPSFTRLKVTAGSPAVHLIRRD